MDNCWLLKDCGLSELQAQLIERGLDSEDDRERVLARAAYDKLVLAASDVVRAASVSVSDLLACARIERRALGEARWKMAVTLARYAGQAAQGPLEAASVSAEIDGGVEHDLLALRMTMNQEQDRFRRMAEVARHGG